MYFSHIFRNIYIYFFSLVNLTIFLLGFFFFLLICIFYNFNINLFSVTHVTNASPQYQICLLYLLMVFFPGSENF